MFVITKEFNGREVCSVEHTNVPAQSKYLAMVLREIVEDPRFSLRVSIVPDPTKPPN